jgi:hypothetical protein
MACDQLAAAEMDSAAEYARCLVALARRAIGVPPRLRSAQALFGRESLEGRVAALMHPTQASRGGTIRSACAGAAALAAVLVPAARLHVDMALAEERGPISGALPRPDRLRPREAAQALAGPDGVERAQEPIVYAPPFNSAATQHSVPPPAASGGAETIESAAAPPSYLRALREAGFSSFSEADATRLHQHGVSAAELALLGRNGYPLASADSLVRLHDSGVPADFVERLRALGYEAVPPDLLVAMWDHGVTAPYIERLRNLGYGSPEPATLVWMWDRGIGACGSRGADHDCGRRW